MQIVRKNLKSNKMLDVNELRTLRYSHFITVNLQILINNLKLFKKMMTPQQHQINK